MAIRRVRRWKNPYIPTPNARSRLEEQISGASNFIEGMISSVDKADIPDNSVSVGKNVRFRFGRAESRAGTQKYTPAKPNSLPVVKIFAYKTNLTTELIIRVTPTTIYKSDGSSWTQLTGTLTGGTRDPVFNTVVERTAIIANGVDKLKSLNLDANTFSDLGALAPRARYVTSFFNRVVAASVGDGSDDGAITVYWSGDRNIDEWDATIDPSAGNSPIVESPADETDFITGVFGGRNLLTLTREKSIWLAQKQPVETDPFNFYNVVEGFGCNLPSSIAVVSSGLAFLDTNTESAWLFQPNQPLEEIGYKVADQILSNIRDPSRIFSGFGKKFRDYIVGVPQSGSDTVKLWVFNLKDQNWSYDEIDNITAIFLRAELGDFISVDELTGQTVDDLAGTTVDDLSPEPVTRDVMYLGTNKGEILKDNNLLSTDDSTAFELDIQTKEYQNPMSDETNLQLQLSYSCQANGNIVLTYSIDGGVTWKTGKTKAVTTSERVRVIKFIKAIRSTRIIYRIQTSGGAKVKILDHRIKRVISGGKNA